MFKTTKTNVVNILYFQIRKEHEKIQKECATTNPDYQDLVLSIQKRNVLIDIASNVQDSKDLLSLKNIFDNLTKEQLDILAVDRSATRNFLRSWSIPIPGTAGALQIIDSCKEFIGIADKLLDEEGRVKKRFIDHVLPGCDVRNILMYTANPTFVLDGDYTKHEMPKEDADRVERYLDYMIKQKASMEYELRRVTKVAERKYGDPANLITPDLRKIDDKNIPTDEHGMVNLQYIGSASAASSNPPQPQGR